MHPNQTTIQEVIDLINDAREKANAKLESILPHIGVAVNARLAQTVGYLSGVGGAAIGSVAQTTSAFPTLMEAAEAEGIQIRKPTTPIDTTPTIDEVEKFRNNVMVLRDSYLSTSDESIFAGLNTPEGSKVLRGVAKLAGLEDYRDAPIDIDFVTRIRKALTQAAAVQAQQDAFRAKENTASQDVTNQFGGTTSEQTATADPKGDMVTASPTDETAQVEGAKSEKSTVKGK